MTAESAAPSAAAANRSDDEKQQHRADRGVEDHAQRSRSQLDAELRQQQSADEGAGDADHHIADEAQSRALHELARQPSRDDAEAAGYTAIVVTVDTKVFSNRERSMRLLGASMPRLSMGNEPRTHGVTGSPTAAKMDLNWDDIEFCGKESGLPVIAKSILSAADALEAERRGTVLMSARQLAWSS